MLHQTLVRQLVAGPGLRPVALGLANNGGVVEVLSSKTGSSWTIIITMPNGPTCMVAAGENWEKIPHIAKAGKQGA